MSRTREALLWMAGLSLVTLALGVLREFTIARELRASGEADLFFRGLVVVGAARSFATALLRARWIPVPMRVPARRLLRAERGVLAATTLVGLAALGAMAGAPALADPTLWVFAAAVALATAGSAVRALAERAGRERRGFLLEWALPVGAIAGALLLPRGALGPALGILAGLGVGLVALLPVLADASGGREDGEAVREDRSGGGGEAVREDRSGGGGEAVREDRSGAGGEAVREDRSGGGGEAVREDRSGAGGDAGGRQNVRKDRSDGAAADRGRTRALLVDALVYANLGLLDAGLSHVFSDGGFALLNYAYLFVNAALMAPTAAATVVGLRVAAGGAPAAHAVLRRWAVIGGAACAMLVVAVGLGLGWGPVASRVDARVGWSISAEISALVLWSAPFAGLRMANTIGRQFVLATAPGRVIAWDLVGLVGRALILGLGAAAVGLAASPLGLAFAEAVQVGAWWRSPTSVAPR